MAKSANITVSDSYETLYKAESQLKMIRSHLLYQCDCEHNDDLMDVFNVVVGVESSIAEALEILGKVETLERTNKRPGAEP